MRVVLSAWGSRGDIQPLAALGVALRDLGVDVRFCVPPDEEFASLSARAGLAMVPMGPAVRSIAAGKTPPSPDAAFQLAAELVAARFETLTQAAAESDALLATGLMPAGARSVAEKIGIPYVLACFHPFGIPSRHFRPARRPGRQSPAEETDNRVLWEQDAERVDAMYREALNRHRQALGLPAVENVRDHVLTARPWLAADPVLAPWANMTDLELVQTGAWILGDERRLPGEVEAFLRAGPPPVYVGFGSMAMRTSADVVSMLLAAVRAHGRRVILASGWAGIAPADGGEDSLVVGDINHAALFPRVAAVVHHGGAGTTTAAALAGTPQVVLPQIVDQPYWAARVVELRIGASDDGSAPTIESLSAALATALSPETTARAREVGSTIRTDGAAVAARRLIALAVEARAGRRGQAG